MLPRQRILRLRNLIPRPSNLHHIPPNLHPHIHPQHIRILSLPFFLFPSCTPREVGLVFAALGVGQVRAIILVDGEAETAFEAADVVFEEVWVFV